MSERTANRLERDADATSHGTKGGRAAGAVLVLAPVLALSPGQADAEVAGSLAGGFPDLRATASAQAPRADEGGDTGSNSDSCRRPDRATARLVPGAERQDADCLQDLTTAGTTRTGHTDRNDWSGLHAGGTENPTGVPGLQIDGYFPDDSATNGSNGWNHDAQFVIRFPNDWNGKVVITGAPGVREQYANDYIISDWVLAEGYAFAATDKGNTGTRFYEDGEEPGDAVAEWNRRVEQLTRATTKAATRYYAGPVERTYITGISNGGYLARYALENTPELYDGGVDWEGTLFRAQGPNLFTYLPVALRNYPDYKLSGDDRQGQAYQNMIEAGFARGSEFLWEYHYSVYWDLTQRIYREEFDPEYDGELSAGVPFCQEGTPNCDANYEYAQRPREVHEAVAKVSLTGDIGKPMVTLHGDLDALLPIRTDSDVYRRLVDDSGKAGMHRYLVIGSGNHVDGLYDTYPDRLRPILPCYRDAFAALDAAVDGDGELPRNGFIPKPEGEDVVNDCDLGDTGPRPSRGPE